ncbi:MAG: endonuclease domain-containing protein [Prochlorotrichaceae cyanobacterium]
MDKDSARIRGTTPEIEEAARKLRQNLTPAEERLWNALRGRKLKGLRFRCQHPVGRFILDFYCPSCKLVVEVDGGIHDQQQDYDKARSDRLEAFGYKVLRFTNDAVMNDLSNVLSEIAEAVALAR